MQANQTPRRNLTIAAAWERTAVSELGGTATLHVRISAARQPRRGERRAPLDLAFVLDRSGSMAGDKLSLVKEAVSAALSLLNDDDRAALIVYDNRVERLQSLAHATSRVKASLRLALHGVDEGGSTNLSGGWLAGCDELAAAMGGGGGRRLRRALLLTDGLANVGITDEAELTHHAAELRRRGISTTALGVGEDFDEGLLSGMSEAGGGNFQYIARPDQLLAFFQDEIGELLSVVAGELKLCLTLPHGVRATLVNPFPHTRVGKRIEVALGDVPAGHQIDLIFDLTVQPGRPGIAHTVAVSTTWTDPPADAERRFDPSLPPLVVTADRDVANAPIDRSVQEEAAIQRGLVAQREAMRLDRAGRHAESRERLRLSATMLAAAPQSARVAELHADLDQLAEMDASQALASAIRKQVTFDATRRSRGKTHEAR